MYGKEPFARLDQQIYKAERNDELWRNYIDLLKKDETNLISVMYGNKLEELRLMLNKENLKGLNDDFQELKQSVQPWLEEKNIVVDFLRRQKDFVGLNQKIRHYINMGKPISKVNDFLGFRLIIDSEESESTNIDFCYEFLERIIKFFVVEKHYILLEAEPQIDIGFDKSQHPSIIVPKKSRIPKEFEGMVKDYIFHPKKNGYQSLHIIIKKPTNVIFEVQIRTKEMDKLAEKGTAKHGLYKRERYVGEKIVIDLSKIHMQGFSVDYSGKIEDTVGLIKSIDPFVTL